MLKVLYMIIVPFWTLILIVWRLFTLLLMIISLPVLFFLPQEIMQNFDEIVNRIALKILWFICRLIRACLLITLVLVLFELNLPCAENVTECGTKLLQKSLMLNRLITNPGQKKAMPR